jgi:DNA-directed RNA polymerase alpha subunit
VDAVAVMQLPSLNLPIDSRIVEIDLPTRVKNALARSGITTVGKVRELADKVLLSFQDLGPRPVAYLRTI